MISKMDVSVFISCYDQDKYIAQAIDSVLSQKTLYNFEIIICDDASQDNSKYLILDYEKNILIK